MSASYLTWVGGTVAGVLEADLVAAAPLASVVFVILFIGLAALTCRSPADARRAVVAGAVAGMGLIAVPAAGAIVVAVACAATASGRRR